MPSLAGTPATAPLEPPRRRVRAAGLDPAPTEYADEASTRVQQGSAAMRPVSSPTVR